MRFPFLDWPGPLAFAHQGAHSPDGPGENTMAAFEAAVALGYRYLETDAHATADGVLVAFHDDRLDRLTDRTGAIGDLPYAEVRAARVTGRDEIPLLEDLLTAWPDVRVNIDPKHDAAVDPLVDLIRAHGHDRPRVLRRLLRPPPGPVRRRLGPRVCTSMGPRQVARLAGRRPGACRRGSFQRRLRAGAGQAGAGAARDRAVRGRRPRPRACRSTCGRSTTPTRCDRLLDLGVDGIMTDRADVLKAVLQERGEWVDA